MWASKKVADNAEMQISARSFTFSTKPDSKSEVIFVIIWAIIKDWPR